MAADSELKRRIDTVIKDNLVLGRDYDLKPEHKLIEDLGADDLDEIEVLMGLEEEFGFAIPEEDMPNLKTVRGIYDYIDKRYNG